jgi:hypothetical protein
MSSLFPLTSHAATLCTLPLRSPDLGVPDLMKPGSSVDLGDHDSNKFDWTKVNVAAGTKVMISILDDEDEEGWSGVVSRKNVSLPIYSLIFSLSRLPSSRAMTSPA